MMRSRVVYTFSIGLLIIQLLINVGCGKIPLERSICEIQGSGLESPFLDQEVITRGLIIADLEEVEPGGYLLLDRSCPVDGDGSRGIYISFEDKSNLLDEGDEIRVRGVVREIEGETCLEAKLNGLEILGLEDQKPEPVNLGDYFIPPLHFGYEKWEGQIVAIPRASVFFDENLPDRIKILPQIDLGPSIQLVCFQEETFSLIIQTDLLENSGDLFEDGYDLEDLIGLLRQDSDGYILQLTVKPNLYLPRKIAKTGDDNPIGLITYSEDNSEHLMIPTNTPTLTPEPTLTITTRPSPSQIPSPTIYPIGLLISEVLPNPAGEEPGGEWIEIFNPTEGRLPLDGIKIGDETNPTGKEGLLRFPDGYHIDGGQVLVIANQARLFISRYGFLPDFELVESDIRVPDLLPYSRWGRSVIKLANSGDEVLLVDPWDRIVDLIVYGESGSLGFSPPVPPPQEGHSLERYPSEMDRDQAVDWRESSSTSPGRLNPSPPTQTSTPSISLTPSPSETFIPARLTTTPTPDQTPTPFLSSTVISQKSATPEPSLSPSLTFVSTMTVESTLVPSKIPEITSTPTILATTSPTFEEPPTSTGTDDLVMITPSGTASYTPVPSGTSAFTVTSTIEGTPSTTPELIVVINEIHSDPDPIRGDSNGDGVISSDDDEFLELVNVSGQLIDLSGWQIFDEVRLRFTFPEGVELAADCGLVIFGGGDPDGDFGGSRIFTTGSLGLNNSGDQVMLLDANGDEIDVIRYGSEGNQDQSLTRDPDLYGPVPLVLHTLVMGAGEVLFSPGTKADGTGFGSCP